MNSLLERVLRFKSISWKDGKFLIGSIPSFISLAYPKVYEQRLMEKIVGEEKARIILFSAGKFQSREGTKIFNDKYGFAKKIPDKKRLLEFNIKQTQFVGWGKFVFTAIDFKSDYYVIKGMSQIAAEYRRLFGLQNKPVDHFMRGQAIAMIEEIIGKKMQGIETKCIAKGDNFCEFVIRPEKMFNQEDPLVKEQIVKEISEKEIGLKFCPHYA